MTRAVIDVGSNSILLLVEKLEDNVWKLVYEQTWITDLGEQVKETGLLHLLT